MKNSLLLIVSAILVLSVQVVSGQQPTGAGESAGAPKSLKQRTFEWLDQDDNDVLTEGEFVGGTLGKAAEEKRGVFRELDADDSGGLDSAEYDSYRPPLPTGDELEEEFERKDENKDGKLSMEESVGQRVGEFRIWGRRNFFRFDADGDDFLTPEELGRRGEGAVLPADRQFKMCDDNDDGVLSEEEFLRGQVGHEWYDWAKKMFHRLDFDQNGLLNSKEFLLTPWLKPDPETLFRGLDTDGDGKLTLKELGRLMNPQQATDAWRSFDRYDMDHDGSLSLAEYTAQAEGVQSARRQQQWKSTFVTWSRRLLIPLVVMMVLFVAFAAYRSWRGRVHGASASAGQVVVETNQPLAPRGQELQPAEEAAAVGASKKRSQHQAKLDQTNLPVAQSIDEFTIVSESSDETGKTTRPAHENETGTDRPDRSQSHFRGHATPDVEGE